MAQPAVRFTRADYDQLPEGLHVELIDGELLKMAEPTFRHQEVARRLFLLFLGHVGEKRVCFGPITFAIDEHNALVTQSGATTASGGETVPTRALPGWDSPAAALFER